MTRLVDLADGFSSATSPSTAIVIDDTTQSTDKDTGALIVEGGVGIEKNINVGGTIKNADTTQSTSKDTGAIVTEGGLGVEKDVYVGGNVVITGNATVNGSITTINSTTLDVTDSNITVNKGGNQSSADLNDAGLTVEMSDATDALIHYDSTATSKFKIGESGLTKEVATISDSQTLTNKTIDYNNNTVQNFPVVPTGSLISYAGSSAPTGYLLCYGQAVSRTTYANLFSAISTTYGVGDGSTTFNLPDLRGRVTVGKDNMGGTGANRITSGGSGVDGTTLGSTGGSQTHTLAESELPAHNHSIVGGTTSNPLYIVNYTGADGGNPGGSNSGTVKDQFVTTNTGSDGAHQNTQPSIIINYIIKT